MKYHTPGALTPEQQEFVRSSFETTHPFRSLAFADSTIDVDLIEAAPPQEIEAFLKKLLYVSRSINRDVLFENRPTRPSGANPMSALEARREVVKIANGIYMFQGTFLKLLRYFDNYFLTLARKHGAVEQEYPTLWPVDLFRQINYFKEFPQQVALVTTVRESASSRKSFAEKYDNQNAYKEVSLGDELHDCRYGLEPAVCDTCYFALRDQTHERGTVFTTYNKVFRHEFSKIESLDRLFNFSVRDIMFVGDPDFVLLMRQRLIDDLIEFLREFDLDCCIAVANDPFFGGECAVKKVYQCSFRLKYELLATLGFSGASIAVGSVNLHQDFFGRAFNIRLPNGEPAHSG